MILKILRIRVSEYLVPETRSHKGTTIVCWESYINGVIIRQILGPVSTRKKDVIYNKNVQENRI